jgi:ABC-type nitrate/sulfonate/bicarbonate transport system substrate-binding protein
MLLFIILALVSFDSCEQKMLENTITIGSYIGEGDSLIFIAEKKGFFKKNGVNVEIKKYEGGIFAIEDILKDKIDIATPSEVAFVSKSFDNHDLKIIAVTTISDIQKLLVRSDSNIKNPIDLKGKKIGTTLGSSAEFALYSYLTLNNMNMKDVTIINLKPSDSLGAIKSKAIDAVISWEPNIYKIKNELGDGVVDLSKKNVPTLYTLLVTKDSIIKKKQKEIQAVLKALVEAEIYFNKNNDDSKTIVRDRIKLSDDYMNYAWKNIYISISLPQDLLFAMESEAKWRIDILSENKTVPNYVKYFYFDFLEKIKPDSISIIR